MEGIIPIQTVHLARQQSVTLHHHQGIGRLHGEDEVVIILRAANVGEFDGALHHTAGSVPVIAQDATAQTPVIGTDAHATIELLAFGHEGQHGLGEVFAFLDVIVLAFVHLVLEVLSAVGEVSGIDADFFDGVGDELRDLGLEVHVGAEGDVVSLFEEPLADLGGGVGLAFSLDGDADEVESLVGASHDLFDGFVDLGGVGGGHGLTNDGMVGTEFDGAAGDGAGGSSFHAVEILAVAAEGSHFGVAGAGFPGGGPEDVFGGGGV
mmetsp:Transcript_38243/g.80471  ORF Transcript_38243/g.80471 Transcript_38243/m.80471 type:complete len:265 (+) Transcript_38243:2120-2914(+)